MKNDIEILNYTDASSLKENVFGLSILLNKNDKKITHVGLSFYDDGEIKLCHYANNGVSTVPLTNKYLLVIMDLDEDDIITICGYFEGIKKINKEIPFSFSIDASRFDSKGKFIPQNSYSGVTCCSFICLGFEVSGYPIVDKETWIPRNEDLYLEKDYMYLFNTDIVSGYKDKLPFPRIRPEELALACGLYEDKSMTFDFISDNINIIDDKLSSIINNNYV